MAVSLQPLGIVSGEACTSLPMRQVCGAKLQMSSGCGQGHLNRPQYWGSHGENSNWVPTIFLGMGDDFWIKKLYLNVFPGHLNYLGYVLPMCHRSCYFLLFVPFFTWPDLLTGILLLLEGMGFPEMRPCELASQMSAKERAPAFGLWHLYSI